MIRLVARRLTGMVPVLFLASLAVFSLVLLVPGDPAATLAGENATVERVAEIRDQLGLNDPIPQQYGRWLSNVVTGDLGTSLYSSQTVSQALGERFPATLSLTFGALVVMFVVGLTCGALAAMFRGRWLDRAVSLLSAAGIAVPGYFIAMLLVVLFANRLGWFPATRYVAFTESPGRWLHHLVLPSFTLGLTGAAIVARQLRSSLIAVMDQDYITMATVKGVRRRTVLIKHACRNAAIPVVTVAGSQVAYLLGGAVIIEQVFAIPGLGDLTVDAVLRRDLPMIQGVVLLSAVLVLVANLVVDLTYGVINPRVRVR